MKKHHLPINSLALGLATAGMLAVSGALAAEVKTVEPGKLPSA